MLLVLAIIFLAFGFIALILGARRVASCSFRISGVLFVIAFAIFAVLLIVHLLR